MTQAYPLQWPAGWPRTPAWRRKSARFDATFSTAHLALRHELKLMGAQQIVLSSNLHLKGDGTPYATQRKHSDEPGVAVYFVRRGKQMVIACDKWNDIADNVQALRKTVDAIRGIERWGASEMIDRAFAGFEALPPADRAPPEEAFWRPWYEILEVSPFASITECRVRRRELAKIYHPDCGTAPDRERMTEINAALNQREAMG